MLSRRQVRHQLMNVTCTDADVGVHRYLEDFLSNNKTQDLLGVDPPKRGNFSFGSRKVAEDFDTAVDWFSFPAQYYLAALLERGIRALVYVGATDYICNWVWKRRHGLHTRCAYKDTQFYRSGTTR